MIYQTSMNFQVRSVVWQPHTHTHTHTQKSDDDMICYFGQLSPFSNFHASKFIVDDCEFVNSEQYIQWTKANYFKDSDNGQFNTGN